MILLYMLYRCSITVAHLLDWTLELFVSVKSDYYYFRIREFWMLCCHTWQRISGTLTLGHISMAGKQRPLWRKPERLVEWLINPKPMMTKNISRGNEGLHLDSANKGECHLSQTHGVRNWGCWGPFCTFFASWSWSNQTKTDSLTIFDCLQQVANTIGADPKEIVFTSGATESNNIAVKGVGRFYSTKKKHIITTQTEHKCVLDSCRQLEAEGFDVTYLPVQTNGIIDMQVSQNLLINRTNSALRGSP